MKNRLFWNVLPFLLLVLFGSVSAQQDRGPGAVSGTFPAPQEQGTGVVSAVPSAQQDQGAGLVSGTLLSKAGMPLSGGLVYFFTKNGPLPDPDRYWRVPDYVVAIGEKGDYSVELPEGDYYTGAIKRAAGATENGPPQVKDLFYKGVDKDGKPKLFSVKKGETTDLGTVSEAVPFTGLATKGDSTGIKGKVVLANGKPVKGALVFAFLNPAAIGKPVFASYRTGKDGVYFLRVQEGGKYYLRARDIYGGGPPVTGAIIGSYGGETPQAVAVETGKVKKGINIVVEKFRGRGQQSSVR
jgi:hypothetical protein